MNTSNNFGADAASASSKRRKTSPEGEEVVLNLAHLPNDQLVTIADYLPNTMRVMFAVALTASTNLGVRPTGREGQTRQARPSFIFQANNTRDKSGGL